MYTMSLPDKVRDSVTIENVVTSAALETELALDMLNSDLGPAQYNPDQFPGLVYRSRDPQGTALLFRSGKMVCTGVGSVERTEEVLASVLDELSELGIECGEVDSTVQNIVGVANLHHLLNLNAIAIGLGLENTEYEPEQFPGLVYRVEDADVVLLLFGSGKVVITGGKEVENIYTAVETVYNRLDDLDLLSEPV